MYSAPWFAAIYLALIVSLIGCIVPRSFQHWRASRADPPPAPRRLSRMPAYRRFEVDASSADVLAAAGDELQSRRFRVLVASGPPPSKKGRAAMSASTRRCSEAGQLRETGNLIFHIAVVVVLVAVAVGSLFGYRATVIVPEGSGFANTVIQYDRLTGGALFDAGDLPPFSLQLDEFDMEFVEAGANGSPED